MSKKTSKRKLRSAVIGVGAMGKHHARNYSQMRSVDLVGVSDLDEKLGKRVAKDFGSKYYKDYQDLLEIEKPDLVSISVPTKFHYPVALDVIKSKIHLLIEKPITFNLDEAQDLVVAAKRARVKLTVGHIERFNPAIIKLKHLVKEGKLGTIVSIMARRAGIIPGRIKDANVILDIGVHDIDLLNFILERKPTNVHAFGGRAILKKHEDYADVLLEYPSGKDGLRVTGHIQTNWLTPVKIRKINITGTKGYAVIDLINQSIILFNSNYTQEFDDFEDFVGKFRESKGKKITVLKREPLRSQLESFVESVLTGSKLAVTAEEAIWALKIAQIATESIKIKDRRI